MRVVEVFEGDKRWKRAKNKQVGEILPISYYVAAGYRIESSIVNEVSRDCFGFGKHIVVKRIVVLVAYGKSKVEQREACYTRVTGPIRIEGAGPREAISEVNADTDCVSPRYGRRRENERLQPRQRQSAEKRG